MNEVRHIVDRMLADPAPPLRAADEVLTIARRAKRRRSWAATGSAVAVLATVLGIVGLAQLGPGGPPVPSPRAASAPVARAAAAQGAVMAAQIERALGVGASPGPPETFSDNPVPYPTAAVTGGPARLLAAAVLPVYIGGRLGTVYAYLVYDGGSIPDDVCAGGAAGCTAVAVGGVTLALTSGTGLGAGVEATRFLLGGRLVVGASRFPPGDEGEPGLGADAWIRPPLAAPPLDPAALAALAADPAMLPN
ncbi:MAG TPA: hypothetical protein VH561_03865 [Micromonosporaceae bacterium]|jgi:hypothetical protein